VGRVRAVLLLCGPLLLAGGGEPLRAASSKPDNLCLTCPRPVPACWLTVYRWQDYNLKAGHGTVVVVTDGAPPSEAEKERARLDVLRSLPPSHTVVIGKSSRIGCPPGARAGE
jgi:hypothetical protein